MKSRPSRHRRLDDALADLPLDEPMLLTELDGYLTGILVCPEAIPPREWLQGIWGSDDSDTPPFDDPFDVQWFVDAVTARYDEIARDLGRGKLQPIFDTDPRTGDVLWEYWVDGFAEAMALRLDGWATSADGDDKEAADAVSRLSLLIAVAREESALDSLEINALQDRAPADLVASVVRLHAARHGNDGASMASSGKGRVEIGRNDPCGCGSDKKFKRCCG